MLRRGGSCGTSSALAPPEDDLDFTRVVQVLLGARTVGRGMRRKTLVLPLRSGDELLCRAIASPSVGSGEEEAQVLQDDEVAAAARDDRIATYGVVVMRRGGDAREHQARASRAAARGRLMARTPGDACIMRCGVHVVASIHVRWYNNVIRS